jgi:hypothetical protein
MQIFLLLLIKSCYALKEIKYSCVSLSEKKLQHVIFQEFSQFILSIFDHTCLIFFFRFFKSLLISLITSENLLCFFMELVKRKC